MWSVAVKQRMFLQMVPGRQLKWRSSTPGQAGPLPSSLLQINQTQNRHHFEVKCCPKSKCQLMKLQQQIFFLFRVSDVQIWINQQMTLGHAAARLPPSKSPMPLRKLCHQILSLGCQEAPLRITFFMFKWLITITVFAFCFALCHSTLKIKASMLGGFGF